MLTKLLISDQPAHERDPEQTTTGDNELLALAGTYQVSGDTGLPCGSGRGADLSSPVIAVITTPASCATGAPGPATTSRATT